MKLSKLIKDKLEQGYKATHSDWMPHEYICLDADGNVIDDRGKAFSSAKFRWIDRDDNEKDWVFTN